MRNKFKCTRIVTKCDATPREIRAGMRCLEKWCISRKYKKQVAGLHPGIPAYEIGIEFHELAFEELIFMNGKCIGAYHDELVFLFDDEKTHFHQKYLGEMKISYDQGIDFYDYYYLYIR